VRQDGHPSPTDPTIEDNWHGGFYELTIKLGPADDARLDAALVALWHAASLPEPFRRHSDAAVAVSGQSLLAGHLHSVATIPGLGSTLCTVLVVREETHESGSTRYGADWLDLCLPLGALGNLDGRVGAYPFSQEAESRGWREPIERWFAVVATAVFGSVPFVHAITGDEVSGMEPAEVQEGRLGVFLHNPTGTLTIEPVRTWS
jgi:hypothetical protein